MAHGLKALAAKLEDLSLVLSTDMKVEGQNQFHESSDPTDTSPTPTTGTHTLCTYTQNNNEEN